MGLLGQVRAQQENINFTSLSTKDGLSSNTVNAILKDRYGLLWFATEDGLDKFDGIGFQVYRQKAGDPASLQANEILALHEDRAGNLWVGTSGGSLSLYDRKKDAFIHFPANAGRGTISNSVIRSICSDENGKIWIAHYDGVDILDPATRRVSAFPLPAGGSGIVSNRSGICVFNDSWNR
ncbi:MAG TPA: two-component regulator propeller domain-containing protein, partial [Flavisolibacter sp.]|nr:two-component regulator propeller domain-containing protein [Flavisolibacter sp.]